MSSKIPYLRQNASNTSGTGGGSKNAVGASSYTDSITLSGGSTKTGIGQGTTPLANSKIKSSKEDIGTKRKIDTRSLSTIINLVNKSLNLPTTDNNTHEKVLSFDSSHYNRFKVANPNTGLQKGYPHIFFVAPMCNILDASGSLNKQFKDVDIFQHINATAPSVLQQLSRINKRKTDFSLLLSNYAKSFSLSDEYIGTDTYGRTFTGYKISYGKNNIESKTAGSFDITFGDTRNLDIYKTHRAWVEYISGCYRGIFSPRNEDILNKVLDYTGALYYILTAEDGETIIFWSKYYGVYPSTIPSTQYSWGEGNAVTKPDLSITYQYSFKEDYNPMSLVEFNYNARASSGISNYLPIYDGELGTVGNTYVTRPYIEYDKTRHKYLLRFQK